MTVLGLDIVDNLPLGILWSEEDEETEKVADVAAGQSTNVATSDAAVAKAFTIRVGTCNVRNTPDLPRDQVIRCGRLVRDDFDLIGFQELGEAGQDRRDVLEGLGPDWRMSVATPADVQTQIGWTPSKLNLTTANWHEAVPGHQPYPNPPRGWTYGICNPLHGFPFGFIDTHFVNKAWNPLPDDHKALRKKNWTIHYQKLQEFIRAKSVAVPVIVVGDFNRSVVAPFTKNFRWIATGDSEHNIGIDKVGIALPAGFSVRSLGHIRVATPSDHDAVGVRIRLNRK